jgi:hypothetical protein
MSHQISCLSITKQHNFLVRAELDIVAASTTMANTPFL